MRSLLETRPQAVRVSHMAFQSRHMDLGDLEDGGHLRRKFLQGVEHGEMPRWPCPGHLTSGQGVKVWVGGLGWSSSALVLLGSFKR